jgi:hypothetical protein
VHISSLLIAFVLLVSTAGCGGSGTSGGTPVSAADFPARFASAWCALLRGCCLESGGTSDSACEAGVAAELTSLGNDAVADGATWDASHAGRCLDLVRAADCAVTDGAKLIALIDVCGDIWTGTVPAGGACRTYESCARPAAIGNARVGASCANSVCFQVATQPPGGGCNDSTMLCDQVQGACSSGICVAHPADGQACTASCRLGSECTGGVCAPLRAAGATCAVNSDCASDKCSGGKCASALAATGDYCTLP